MRSITRRILCLTLLLGGTAPLLALEVSLPVPGRGSLRFDLPGEWREDRRGTPKDLPPTVGCERTGPVRGSLLVTVMWSSTDDPSFAGEEGARQAALLLKEKIAVSAVEKEIPLERFQGAQGAGFRFAARDRTFKPGPGQFPVVTAGVLAMGRLVLYFTILSDRKDDAAVREALAAVGRAALQ